MTRLRCDRVLYQVQPPPTGKQGQTPKHGSRFAFKEPHSWGAPDEISGWKTLTGDKYTWSAGANCMRKKVPTFRTMSSGPAFTRNGKNHRRHSGWPGFHSSSLLDCPSPYKPSGAHTTAAGRLNRDCTSAKPPWAGRCHAFKAKRRGIAGRGSGRSDLDDLPGQYDCGRCAPSGRKSSSTWPAAERSRAFVRFCANWHPRSPAKRNAEFTPGWPRQRRTPKPRYPVVKKTPVAVKTA